MDRNFHKDSNDSGIFPSIMFFICYYSMNNICYITVNL